MAGSWIVADMLLNPGGAGGKTNAIRTVAVGRSSADGLRKRADRATRCKAAYLQLVQAAPHGEGVTDIAFVIDTRGHLQDIRIAKSSGFDEIDKASMGCAAHWHYFPATQDGKPVEQRWGARIDWRGNTVAVFELALAP
jgi:TonB family protein